MATRPKTTRLSNDVTKPQPTATGDAPADTWDPAERATSVRPDKAAAAARARPAGRGDGRKVEGLGHAAASRALAWIRARLRA